MGKLLLFPVHEPEGRRWCTVVKLYSNHPWYDPTIERLKQCICQHHPAFVRTYRMESYPLTLVIEGRIDRRIIADALYSDQFLIEYVMTDAPERLFSGAQQVTAANP